MAGWSNIKHNVNQKMEDIPPDITTNDLALYFVAENWEFRVYPQEVWYISALQESAQVISIIARKCCYTFPFWIGGIAWKKKKNHTVESILFSSAEYCRNDDATLHTNQHIVLWMCHAIVREWSRM